MVGRFGCRCGGRSFRRAGGTGRAVNRSVDGLSVGRLGER